jgi:hypothetical protein
MFLYGPTFWIFAKEQIRKMETTEMRFLWGVTEYRMKDKGGNENWRQ